MQAAEPGPLRIVLAEDHRIVREGVRALLASREDLEVVGEAEDGPTAIEATLRLRPDVVLMDLGLPRLHGTAAIAEIRSRSPETRVLVLSMHSGEDYVRSAIRAGANGYLLKGSGLDDLVAAIKAVAAGEAFFSPAVARVLLDDARPRSGGPAADALTEREREVLRLVAEGNSSREIAGRLGLSAKTVEGHRSRIMSKLGIRDLAGLVRYAVRTGLVSEDG